ncbi:MAG: hypothetical protein ABW039_08830 [Sphingobium sp.]
MAVMNAVRALASEPDAPSPEKTWAQNDDEDRTLTGETPDNRV